MTKAVVFERMKANTFFFVGSLCYLPVALWDFIAEHQGSAVSPRDSSIFYSILEVTATLAYLGNGLLETRTAYRSRQEKKLEQMQNGIASIEAAGKYDIYNGLLFTIAAMFNVIYALKPKIVWLSLSSHFYVINALFTLWLRRGMKETRPAKMVRAGDILFFLGATMDTIGTYLEASKKLTNPAGMWLFSASAWFADAILYLIADKMSLDEHIEAGDPTGPKASQPMIYPQSELTETATTVNTARLSDIV